MQVCRVFSRYIPHHVLHLYRHLPGGVRGLPFLPGKDPPNGSKQRVEGQPSKGVPEIPDARLAFDQILELAVFVQHPPNKDVSSEFLMMIMMK